MDTHTPMLTVLGSGGPFAQPARASSGHLLEAGRIRLLVDCGGGVFERLGRTGVDPATLSAVLLTHTHIDHSGGLAPVLFAAAMAGRRTPVPVVGPDGRDQHPGCRRFTELLFGEQGAWSYLNTFPGFGVTPVECRSDPVQPPSPVPLPGVQVRAVGVPHGMMPSLAYRIDVAGASVTVSGDVSCDAPGLVDLARGSDLLVQDMALPERDVPHGDLHARPSQVGAIAAAAGVRHLLLTHVMPELEDERAAAEMRIRDRYDGQITWAHDLLRVPVRRQT